MHDFPLESIRVARGRGRTRAAVWARSVFLEAGSFLGPFALRGGSALWYTRLCSRCSIVPRKRPRERTSASSERQRGTARRKISRAKIQHARSADAAAHLTKERPFWLLTDAGTYLPPASCILFSCQLIQFGCRRKPLFRWKNIFFFLCCVRWMLRRIIYFCCASSGESNQVEKLMNAASMRAHAHRRIFILFIAGGCGAWPGARSAGQRSEPR